MNFNFYIPGGDDLELKFIYNAISRTYTMLVYETKNNIQTLKWNINRKCFEELFIELENLSYIESTKGDIDG